MDNKKFINLTITNSIILIVIISTIILVAYPMYKRHVINTKRSAAKFALLKLVGAMERHYTKFNTYKSATIGKNPTTDIINNANIIDNWYRLEITHQTDYDYVLSAIPLNDQAKEDTKCGTLSISKYGDEKISGTGETSECWD